MPISEDDLTATMWYLSFHWYTSHRMFSICLFMSCDNPQTTGYFYFKMQIYLFSNVIPDKWDCSVWNWPNTVNIYSAL